MLKNDIDNKSEKQLFDWDYFWLDEGYVPYDVFVVMMLISAVAAYIMITKVKTKMFFEDPLAIIKSD